MDEYLVILHVVFLKYIAMEEVPFQSIVENAGGYLVRSATKFIWSALE